jgi:hypothetical protein
VAPSKGGGGLDQRSSDAVPPTGWFDEKSIKLCIAIITRQDHREPEDRAVAFGDEDAICLDLSDRQFDGIRMRKQVLAIRFVHERCAALQGLKRALLGSAGETDAD